VRAKVWYLAAQFNPVQQSFMGFGVVPKTEIEMSKAAIGREITFI